MTQTGSGPVTCQDLIGLLADYLEAALSREQVEHRDAERFGDVDQRG